METWVEAARRDTPGSANVVHLNNAGGAAAAGGRRHRRRSHPTRSRDRRVRSSCTGVGAPRRGLRVDCATVDRRNRGEIAVVENATRAWDMAVYGYPFRRGDRVLTARAEYASNVIALLQLQRRHGIEIVLIDDDEHGQVSLDHLGTRARGRVPPWSR